MAMYSAALVPHVGKARLSTRALISYLMVDQAFAVAVTKYEETPNMTLPEKLAYYFGCMSMLAPLWYLFSLIGALVGQAIPAELSLDFAMPVCFIALTAPLLRSAPHVVAAIVSVVMAVAFAWLPWNMGLLVAAALAMIAGAQTELYLNRKRAAQEVTV
jgi:predicted branched-subunit amino acid permease